MPKQIAPRLVSGEHRITWGGNLPPKVKEAVKLIASDENKSVSWVLENVVIDYFSMSRPKYRKKKQVKQGTSR